jgi:hypothetical protein
MTQQLSSHQLNATVRAAAIPQRMDLSAGQLLHFPLPLLTEVRHFAAEIDRSVGWCLWMAWCLAVLEHAEGASPLVDTEVPDGEKIPEQVTMPLGTWRHVTREAERLDRSKSWLLARAWVAARPRMADAASKAG